MPQDQVRQVTLNVDLGYAKSILGICKVLEFVSCQSILSQGFPLKIWDGGGGGGGITVICMGIPANPNR